MSAHDKSIDLVVRLRKRFTVHGVLNVTEPPLPMELEAANEIEHLRSELEKFDPDPVVCDCHEAHCPHMPIAQLPRRELVKHYKERINYLTGCVRDLTDEVERWHKELKDHMWWERTAVELQRQRDVLSAALRRIASRDVVDAADIAHQALAGTANEFPPRAGNEVPAPEPTDAGGVPASPPAVGIFTLAKVRGMFAALERIALGSACDDPSCTSMFHEGCDTTIPKDQRYKTIARIAIGLEQP